jgi:hypothetical protein
MIGNGLLGAGETAESWMSRGLAVTPGAVRGHNHLAPSATADVLGGSRIHHKRRPDDGAHQHFFIPRRSATVCVANKETPNGLSYSGI